MVSKEKIVDLLMTRDAAVARALVVLNERQTADERNSEATKYSNQRGFSAAHAKRGTSMANFYMRAGFLTPKQLAWWRAAGRVGGKPRIATYAEQLMDAARIKAERCNSVK